MSEAGFAMVSQSIPSLLSATSLLILKYKFHSLKKWLDYVPRGKQACWRSVGRHGTRACFQETRAYD
jgi:hypothetical protein